jgi:hypothetical protein
MKTLANALFVPPTAFVAAMAELAGLPDADCPMEGDGDGKPQSPMKTASVNREQDDREN